MVGVGAERLATRSLRADDRPDEGHPIVPTPHHFDMPDGGVAHVMAIGSGPPLVLLHGITLRADIWHHQFALADEATVYAVDLRGHGLSVSGTDGPTIEANARDLAFLLNKLDLRGAVIAGHSMGGMVLGRFLADHPDVADERVAGVAFISTAARNPVGLPSVALRPFAAPLQDAARRYPKLARRLADIPGNDLGQILVRSTFGASPDVDDIRETALAFESIGVDELLAAAPSILDHDVLRDLERCELPASVIVGSRDPLTPPKLSRRLAAALPNAELEIVPGAGHQLMLERPDEVNDMLRSLLARAAVRRR